jgi:hypothetical protein
MPFLNIGALLLLIGGSLLGYGAATDVWWMMRRWQVMVSAAAGGAMVAVLLFVVVLLTDFSTAITQLSTALRFVGWYGLFGLVLGLVALITRTERRRYLFLLGLAIIGLLTLIRVAINAATHRPVGLGALGVQFGIHAPVLCVLFYLVVAWVRVEHARWAPVRSR